MIFYNSLIYKWGGFQNITLKDKLILYMFWTTILNFYALTTEIALPKVHHNIMPVWIMPATKNQALKDLPLNGSH